MPPTDPELPAVGAYVGSFDAWYLAEHPRLLAAMTVVARDPDLARDATDEAFARAYERWSRVSAMRSPAGWTYRTAANVVRRRQRRRSMEGRLLSRQHPPAQAPPALDHAVWDAVAALPDRQRTAIALRYALGLTQAEVAQAMGIAPGTVSATLVAARRSLAPLLDPDASTPTEATNA